MKQKSIKTYGEIRKLKDLLFSVRNVVDCVKNESKNGWKRKG